MPLKCNQSTDLYAYKSATKASENIGHASVHICDMSVVTTINFTSLLYIGLDLPESVATVMSVITHSESVKLPNVMYIIVASNWHKCSTAIHFLYYTVLISSLNSVKYNYCYAIFVYTCITMTNAFTEVSHISIIL